MPTRNCLDCGKEFYTRTTAVRCVECRTVYKKKLAKEYSKRTYPDWYRNDENRKRQIQKSSEYRKAHREHCKEYQKNYYQTKLKAKRKLGKLPSTEVEVDGKKITLYECPRLRVKASKLPCGERWECFHNGRCSFVPKGKEPKTFEECVIAPRGRFNPAF